MKLFKINRGQTLIEVLIAFATLAVIITASTLAVISALNNSEFLKNQHLALQYAQQGMEVLRSIRENDFNTFLQLSNPDGLPTPPGILYYCMAKSCTSLVPSTCGSGDGLCCGQVTVAGFPCAVVNDDAFIRSVSLNRSPLAQNECNGVPQTTAPTAATVTVSWIDGQCPRGTYCHSVSVTSCLGTVNTVPTP